MSASGQGPAPDAAVRKIFSGPVAFVKSAPALEFLPEPDLPEIAFAGRSNVGKSALINRLTNRSTLARTSNTPGRTQALNIFDVGEPPVLRLVDMPGYGFARAPKGVAGSWRRLIDDYLRGRATLKRALLLIDARHGLKDIDREVMAMLDTAAVSYRIVITKADKAMAADLAIVARSTAEELRRHGAAHPDVLITSVRTGAGMDALRSAVLEAAQV